jgi:hypothetical protein
MNKLFIAWSLIALFLAGACTDDKPAIVEELYMELSQDLILAGDTLTRVRIEVNTNSEYWDADVTTPTEWCTFAMNDVPGDRSITITTGQNTDANERTAILTVFGDGDLERNVTIRQMGTSPVILTSTESFPRLRDDSTSIQLYVQANLEFEVIIPDTTDWIIPLGTLEEDSTIYLFTVTRNGTTPRQGIIQLKGVAFNYLKEISVAQLGRDSHYTPADPSDMGAVADAKLRVSRSSVSSYQGSDVIGRSHDGDINTMWHSNWGGGELPGIWAVYEMDDANALDYIVYTPRQSGANGELGEFDLYIAVSPDLDDYIYYGAYDFGMVQRVTSRITFPETVVKPRKVKFEIKSGRGGFASAAEMEFFAHPQKDTALMSIFTDETYSELKTGVTYAQVMAMENAFLRNIAKYLYNGEYSSLRTRAYKPYRPPANIAAEWKTNPYSLWDNPTGIYARENEDVVVFVGPLGDESIALGVADVEDSGGLYQATYPLAQGENKVRITHDGLLYIYYYTENYRTAPPVKIHVASGEVNGYFDVAQHRDADWPAIIANAAYYLIDVVGERSHLLFPVADLKTISNPAALVGTWDDIVRLEQEFMGIQKYNREHANRIFCHVDNATGNMYASPNHTGYSYQNIPDLVQVNKLRGSEVWGPAHEIGHMNQVRPGLKWVGLGEVSNNIYSLHVQTSFGNASRLLGDGYSRGFTEILAAGIPYLALTDDPYFPRLVPFWQLHLFGLATGRPDLYKDVSEQVRVNPDKDYATRSGEIQLDFVKYCCDALQSDLSDFFEAWGFLREQDLEVGDYSSTYLRVSADEVRATKDYIAAKGYAPAPAGLLYLTDLTVDVLRRRANITPGTAARSGQRVTATNWTNVMAYKVYYNGNFVLATHDATINIPAKYPADNVEIKAVQWDGTEINVTF